MIKFPLFCSALMLLVVGCMLGPKGPPAYRDVSPAYQETDPALCVDEGDLSLFWQSFNDPVLLDLIGRCMKDNFDVRIAEEKVKELRANYRMESAALWPSVNAKSYALRVKKPAAFLGLPLPQPSVENFYVLGFDASWEIDFFGKVASARKAAYFDVLSQEEQVHSTQVSVVAEVARLYTDIRTCQQRLEVARKKIEVQKKILSLSLVLSKSGLGDDIDIEQEKATLALDQTAFFTLQKEMKDALYQITYLLGLYPSDTQELASKRKAIPFARHKVPIGLPSELLKRRPDVRMAERNYTAAAARVGNARAELFPSIRLSGTWSVESTELNNLFAKTSQLWFVGPSINWNLFQGWKNMANIKVQSSRLSQALLDYQKSIANALCDVEGSLTAYGEDNISLHSYRRAASAKRKGCALRSFLVEYGLNEQRLLLLSELEFYQAQDNYLQGKKSLMVSLIALYKALGGGWQMN